MFEVGKGANVKLSESNRIVLAHLCEDCKLVDLAHRHVLKSLRGTLNKWLGKE